MYHHWLKLLIVILFTIFPMREILAQHIFTKDDLAIGLNVGTVSYFGDLSIYDFEPLNKLRFESGMSGNLILSKQISQYLTIKINYRLGNTKGNKPTNNTSFYNRFNEMSLELSGSLKKLIFPYSSTAIDFGIQAGYGVLLFRAVSYNTDNMNVINYEGLNQNKKNTGNPQLATGFSSGYYIAYPLNDKLLLNHNVNFVLLNTDKFDATVGSTGIHDRIMFTNFGIVYRITPSNFDSNREECPSFGEWNKFRKR